VILSRVSWTGVILCWQCFWIFVERVGGTVLRWFKSYLCDRYQKVKLKNYTSQSQCIRHGVPQGTVLGPLLFLLYINDIVGAVRGCKLELFADDTMLYIAGGELDIMERTVNSDLDSLFNWLCVNASKSKFCLFGKKHSLKSVNFQSLNIVINNQKIIHESEIKYLGVIFDQSLTFYAHADYITRKFAKKVGYIA